MSFNKRRIIRGNMERRTRRQVANNEGKTIELIRFCSNQLIKFY